MSRAAAHRLIGRLRGFGAAALDSLLPPHCAACAAPVASQGLLCALCVAELSPIAAPMCETCGIPFLHPGEAAGQDTGGSPLCAACLARPPPFATARAAFLYNEGAKRLVLPFKHGDRPELAEVLAARMAVAGRQLLAAADLLLPVPLHRSRLRARRYNQAALLAAKLSRHAGVPMAPGLLRRTRATPSLGDRGAAARAEILEDAFCLMPGGARLVTGKRLLLVDDVLTSGATAGACARVLLEAGAREVNVIASTRVTKND